MSRPQNAHNPANEFQTPPEVLEPLYPYLSSRWRIWEPAKGNGNLCEALEERGYKVEGTDILSRFDSVDFLDAKQRNARLYEYETDWSQELDRHYDRVVGRRYDCIITNPPYNRGALDPFIKTCFETGLPFALLVPLTCLEGTKTRIPAYIAADPRPQVIIMGRVRFTTPSGLQGMDSNPTFAVMWLTWGLGLERDLMWWHEGDLR